MRDFNKVSPTLWQSGRFLGLPSDDGRLLYLYLLTCPHQNSAGCFWLPDGYACTDIGWSRERYYQARQQLIDADLIEFDESEQVILIMRWFRHNPPMNPSHVIGIEKVLMQCPSIELREQCHEDMKLVWLEKNWLIDKKQTACSEAEWKHSERLCLSGCRLSPTLCGHPVETVPTYKT